MNLRENLDMRFPPGSAAVALGFFDGLHIGHMAVIRETVRQAKENGKTPCVFTFTPGGVFPYPKGGQSLLGKRMSERILREEGVRELIRPNFSEFGDLSPEAFVRDILAGKFGAAYAVCGENYRFGKNAAGDAALLKKLCNGLIDLTVIPMQTKNAVTVSSGSIRALLREGEIEKAAELSGRPFSIDFTVCEGKKLGRKIGIPTINQPFPDDFVRPKFGVYASISHVNGRQYPSVTNIGVKPTVGSDTVLAETYIHDFSGSLYGQNIQVDLISFIRPERKFASIAELKEQILRDCSAAQLRRIEDLGFGF